MATDYFGLRSVDAQRRVLEDTLKNYRQNVELTTTLYKTGIDSEQELTQAQNQLDVATAQTTDLGVARAQYEHAIAMLIGQPASNFSIPAGDFNPHPPEIPVGVPSELLERRPATLPQMNDKWPPQTLISGSREPPTTLPDSQRFGWN